MERSRAAPDRRRHSQEVAADRHTPRVEALPLLEAPLLEAPLLALSQAERPRHSALPEQGWLPLAFVLRPVRTRH